MKALMACLLLLFAGTAQPLDLPLWNGISYNDAVPSTGADKLHALGITGKGLTTAIIDGGFDTSHEIFEGRTIYENHAAGADEHGNHVAGIVVSMAPDSDLWLADFSNPEAADHKPAFAKLLEDAGGGNQYNIVSVNNSWGYDYFYYATQQDAAGDNAMDAELVRRIIDSGIAVVVASGNDALNDLLTVPAGFPGVVSVGAMNPYGNIADFSNQAGVTLLAPGVDIFSAGLAGGYVGMDGTSMAAPHVTGAITLLQSGARSASAAEIVSALYDSALPVEYDGNRIISKEHVPEEGQQHPGNIYATLLALEPTGNGDLAEYFAWLDGVFIPHYRADEVTADEWRTFSFLSAYSSIVWYSYNVDTPGNGFTDAEGNDLYGRELFLAFMDELGGLDTKLEDQTFGFLQADAAYRLLTSRRAEKMAGAASGFGSSHAGSLDAFSREMGAYLDQNLVDLFQRLDGQPAAVLARAARQLGPGRVADTLHSSIFGMLGLHSMVARRLPRSRAPQCGTTLWAESFGSYHDRDETINSGGYHGSFAGLMVGMEKDFGEALAGGFAAWANHNIHGDGASRGNWGTFGFYGGLIRDHFSAGLSVAVGMGDYSLTRQVDGPAISLIGMDYAAMRIGANGDSTAASFSARASADWTLTDHNGWKFDVGAEAAFAHAFMSGYTERDGGGINLTVRRHGESYAEGGAGLRASKIFFRCDKPFLTASVKASALYGAGFGSDMTARFTGAGSSFSVESERIKTAWFVPEASLSWKATERVTVSASYQGRFGRHASTNTASLSVGLDW